MDEIEINVRKHSKVLASDEFDGRFPGSDGEKLTIEYISNVFASFNAKTILQELSMKKITQKSRSDLIIVSSSQNVLECEQGADFICHATEEKLSFDNIEMVYLGFGIIAEEYNWNDYEGVDVKGKIVVVLVNDPGLFNKDLFEGDKMTYYGRWTYKYEEAFRQGAAGVFVIHDTKGAGYPFSVLQSTDLIGTRIELENPHYPPLSGWITGQVCSKLFKNDYNSLGEKCINDSLYKKSIQEINKEFSYFLSVKIENELVGFKSSNIYCCIDPLIENNETEKKKDAIIYTAHWDHFGSKEKDVYSGARDNALSVATVIELARLFESKKDRKLASIFMLPTAEEQGLLGSKYFVDNLNSLNYNIISVINFDLMNIFGATKDITFYGFSKCGFNKNIENIAVKCAERQGRIVKPDPDPQNGMFYRSDHWPFAQIKIPALFFNMGFDSADNDEEDYILKKNRKWTEICYHKPGDKYIDDKTSEWCWDLKGMMQDFQLAFMIGEELMNQ